MKALKEKHQFESDLSFERRLGASAINQIIGTLSTMTFGVALLFAFAGWIAGCSR